MSWKGPTYDNQQNLRRHKWENVKCTTIKCLVNPSSEEWPESRWHSHPQWTVPEVLRCGLFWTDSLHVPPSDPYKHYQPYSLDSPCLAKKKPSKFNVFHPEMFNTYINIQWCISQTQQNFIMFIIVLGRHVSILIESSSDPSMYKMHFIHSFIKNESVWDPTTHFKHCQVRICIPRKVLRTIL